ncbi:Exocyst complex component sec15 [Fulvia fulva]|uniref:Exocyst complex component SEC15 n=1 Tax=Passalora fulva TaxID=5499 RepID=A0A9Q8PAX0_PASFU|nr:Exocyst complex component sec15 [Fulvia fulva]KAK4622129.1 Exocyst complex component sec15 [Fulvia fulva]KAK4623153.1 Exocyst complex component sec15 [Fulvia fulva]UJO19116.1 Exocyst complex component sec15 [Fulvia fulva]WPV15849.1 Exocyst complex component sec15 [Fulvia fulva]WPV31233.1 Exocyst complex component sec15 [Fulvia fulva]
MPGLITGDQYDDLTGAVQQIILSSSESDYLDQLIPLLKNAETQTQVTPLIHALNHVSADREAQIENICNSNHQEFIGSVNQLQSVREGTVNLTSEIMELSRSIQASTEKLAEHKKALVESRGVRQNIDDATQALKDCLEVLRLANQVHDLLGKKNHYAALRALDELQNVHLREVTRYKIAEMIERSVPATQRMIADAVMLDLNTWLYRIRETSQFLGEVAFYHIDNRRDRQRLRLEAGNYAGNFKLNSAVELVADEPEEFDVLNNDEVSVDFTPLFECLHIHDALGETEKFRADYAATRRRQKDLLIPQTVNLTDEESNSLSSLMEGVAGFAIVEKATMQRTENFRAQSDVDELWDSMSQSVVSLISSALHNVDNDENLLRIKGIIALFIQTMDSWGYPVSSLDSLLLTLFDKYSSLLKKRFSDDFQEIVSTDDYMPMPINNAEEYDKVISVSWYTPPPDQEASEDLEYPRVLPFSQMYPLVCIDIRNFLNQIYLFSDDHFRHTTVIDKTLKDSLDELLVDKVCRSLVDRLSSQYPGQIVQILTNLEHFESACKDLEALLVEARSSSSAAGPIKLNATSQFGEAKKKSEKRIFELVNSKIDDLIETAEYDWLSTYVPDDASPYIQELTRYLTTTINNVLLGLPEHIKSVIYFEALSHVCEALLSLPLDPMVRRISPQAVAAYKLDVEDLAGYVESLPDGTQLLESLGPLRQTTDLMALAAEGKGEEFFDSSKSNVRFGKVDKLKGAELLEKVMQQAPEPTSARRERHSLLPDFSGGSGEISKKPSMPHFGDFRDRLGQFAKRDRS